jgi:hypothetical protein
MKNGQYVRMIFTKGEITQAALFVVGCVLVANGISDVLRAGGSIIANKITKKIEEKRKAEAKKEYEEFCRVFDAKNEAN